MPIIICSGCDRETNTAVCEIGEFPTYCFAARVNNKWVKGCAFEKAPDYTKAFCMSKITGKSIKSFLRKKEN